jgi:hypothetical protein
VTRAARLEQPEVQDALDREVLSCVEDELWRAFRRQPSLLARRVVS